MISFYSWYTQQFISALIYPSKQDIWERKLNNCLFFRLVFDQNYDWWRSEKSTILSDQFLNWTRLEIKRKNLKSITVRARIKQLAKNYSLFSIIWMSLILLPPLQTDRTVELWIISNNSFTNDPAQISQLKLPSRVCTTNFETNTLFEGSMS